MFFVAKEKCLMKTTKQLFILLFVFIAVFLLCLSAGAQTEGEPLATVVETGNCGIDGSDVQYRLYDNGTLVISGSGMIQSSFFSGRSDILKVTIENGVTGADYYAFNHCNNLESVSLPKTFQMSNGDSFFCCMGLKHIFVDAQSEYLTVDAFGVVYNKDKTTLIKLPTGSDLTEYTVPDGVEVIEPEAFYVCKMLKKLVIPDSVKTIHVQAFCEDYALESLRLPSHLNYLGERVFGLCSSLRHVAIPKGVSEIGYEMFAGCKSLASVVIPETVTKIGLGAFSNCEALRDVYVMMDQATWNRNVTMDKNNDCLLNANLHFLPDDSAWLALPYGADGLEDGDWYLDIEAFVDMIGRGKSAREKAEVRALIEQHMQFSYYPGSEQCVYKYTFTDLPAEDGTPVSGTVVLPLDLSLGNEDAFPYDYSALQQCVRQYHASETTDTPQADDDGGNWFELYIIRPLRSAIATILSFFRRLFGKKK